MKIITVPGSNAMDEMKRLLGQRASTGLHPVLFGSKDSADFIYKGSLGVKDPAAIIAESLQIDVAKLIAEFYHPDEWEDGREEDEQAEEEWIMDESDSEAGEDDVETGDDDELDLSSAKQGRKLLETVHIGLLEIAQPWQVFAHLGWGDENTGGQDIWGSAMNCAIHRRWQEEWGAEVVALQETVIECFVARPPLTRRDAMRLAREQYYYCSDIVHQGVGSIPELADTLMGYNQSYFWWD